MNGQPMLAKWPNDGSSHRFGRNRESRSREAAGRRNWPEAVPRKRSGRKRSLKRLSENWLKVRTRVINDGGKTGESLPLIVLHL